MNIGHDGNMQGQGQGPPGQPGQGGSNHNEEHRKQVLKQQQQRLLLLRHASKCPHDGGRCPVTPHCASMKQLWKHTTTCKDQECKVAHCVSSRYVVGHYTHCKDLECPVCGPVREAIRRCNFGTLASSRNGAGSGMMQPNRGAAAAGSAGGAGGAGSTGAGAGGDGSPCRECEVVRVAVRRCKPEGQQQLVVRHREKNGDERVSTVLLVQLRSLVFRKRHHPRRPLLPRRRRQQLVYPSIKPYPQHIYRHHFCLAPSSCKSGNLEQIIQRIYLPQLQLQQPQLLLQLLPQPQPQPQLQLQPQLLPQPQPQPQLQCLANQSGASSSTQLVCRHRTGAANNRPKRGMPWRMCLRVRA